MWHRIYVYKLQLSTNRLEPFLIQTVNIQRKTIVEVLISSVYGFSSSHTIHYVLLVPLQTHIHKPLT